MSTPIDFLGVQAFLSIVEAGSFQLAAAQLSLSQTAISHRMRKFEDNLGVRLFVRSTREITLTEAGQALLPRARSAVMELASAIDGVRQHSKDPEAWLTIACLPTVATGILGPLLSACRRKWPNAPIRVFDNSAVEIAELVESRTASFGISVMRGTPPGLAVERVIDEPFVLVCPEAHPFTRFDEMRWSELHDESLIRISSPAGTGMAIDEALGTERATLRWRYEAQHLGMALEMVREGLGLTIVPKLSVGDAQGVHVIAITGPLVVRTLCVITRRDTVLSADDTWVRDRAVSLLKARVRVKHGNLVD